ISRKADTEFVFDIDLALKQSDENPVYYVQYAHARICTILGDWMTQGEEVAPDQIDEDTIRRGRDAVRFFLISRKADTEFVFDIDLALKQSDENPVYYVQYAHARICTILGDW
ncbi:hypothetical protein ACRXB1_37490, partial [Caballeronia sp. M23-90]